MQKIILTIIILAVAKPVFAAHYLDATRMQTVPFPITPSLTIKARMDALEEKDRSNKTAADAALAKANAAPKGSEALTMAKNIRSLILESDSCLKDTDTDCTQNEIDYEEKNISLGGLPGVVYTWRVPKGVVSVEFSLFNAVGQVPRKRSTRDTWLFGPTSVVVAHGESAFRSSLIKTVPITQEHRDNGIKYYKGIGVAGFHSGTNRRHGSIRAKFREPR